MHQRSVNCQHTRDPTSPRHPGRDEREIEELSVLVDHIGLEIPNDVPDLTEHSSACHEWDGIVELHFAGLGPTREQPNDANSVDHVGACGSVGLG